MPNRNIQGDYRYAFQGQEKDPETGKEAFELRLWDSRIGRWLTTDPYGQYASPYLGMGNNPISNVDPDGGMACPDPPCQTTVSSIVAEGFTPLSGEISGLGSQGLFPNTSGVQNLSEVIISSSGRKFDFTTHIEIGSLLNDSADLYLGTLPTTLPKQRFNDFSQLGAARDGLKYLERINKYRSVTSAVSVGFTGLSVLNDGALYATGQQSGARTTYHIGATGVSVTLGYVVSAPAALTATAVFASGEYIYDGISAQRIYNAANNNSQSMMNVHNVHNVRVNSGQDLNVESLEYYLSNGQAFDGF